MTPDELVVIMLERLAKSKVDFTVESYTTTRAAAERLLRTVGAIPEEPQKQLEAPPAPSSIPHAKPHPALASRESIDSPTQTMPVYQATVTPTYRRGRREVYSGS